MPIAPTFVGLPLGAVFIVYSGAVAVGLAGLLLRRLPRTPALAGVAGLGVWLAYDALLSRAGLLAASSDGPPGMALLAGPPSALVLLIGVSPLGRGLAQRMSLPLILSLQSFRIGVELTLLALAQAGLVPHLLTLAGGNTEILVGLTAPLAAWASTRGDGGRRIALIWNGLGLASLINVAVRSALSMPGPLHLLATEVPNLAMGAFPYCLIPGFMAPIALLLHVLAFRARPGAPIAPSARRAVA